MSQSELHISSMVVHTSPDALPSVRQAISGLRGAEIHGESAAGKLVVVLESDNQSRITDVIERINGIPRVLGTALVYHQIEPLQAAESES